MYYSAIGLLAAAILLIENYHILLRPDAAFGKPAWVKYRRFLVAVLVYYATDIRWGILESRKLWVLLFADIRRFAKRQDIWFRKLERKGIPIHWLEKDPFSEASELVGRFLAGMSLPAPGRRMIDTLYGRRSQ